MKVNKLKRIELIVANKILNMDQFELSLNKIRDEIDSITFPSMASELPKPNGEGSAGTSLACAREDHVHPEQVDIIGNSGTSDKFKSAQLIGGESFNGTQDINPKRSFLQINYDGMPADMDWSSICYGDGKFIAATSNNVIYSSDGINWEFVECGYIGGQFIQYGNGIFVTVDGNGTNTTAMYSTDGINWTSSELPTAYGTSFDGFIYGNNRFIILTSENTFVHSTDGIIWTLDILNPINRYISDENGNDITEAFKSIINS